MSQPAIQVNNLQKIYANGTHALKGLDLEISQGEFFALLGPNGSGKSTFINIMAGSTKKTSGQIKILGLDIDKHRQETKMLLGIVPQEISFDSFFTVNEALNLQSGYYGIHNNQKYIDEILEKLHLKDKKYSNTRALSGGMKRRLLIAKALVHHPKVIVLDEPTAGVDIELRHTLWEYMNELNRQGITILLTTHYLEEAESLCERTAIISLGKLVALDKTKKIAKSAGNKKTITLNFSEPIKEIPHGLQKFNPVRKSEYELSIDFEIAHIAEVLKSLDSLTSKIIDLDLESQKLEDAFLKLTKTKK